MTRSDSWTWMPHWIKNWYEASGLRCASALSVSTTTRDSPEFAISFAQPKHTWLVT